MLSHHFEITSLKLLSRNVDINKKYTFTHPLVLVFFIIANFSYFLHMEQTTYKVTFLQQKNENLLVLASCLFVTQTKFLSTYLLIGHINLSITPVSCYFIHTCLATLDYSRLDQQITAPMCWVCRLA